MVLTFVIVSIFPIGDFFVHKEVIVTYLSSFASLAPLLYIVLQVVTILIVPIPSVVLATAAGALFGFWQAVPYTTIAWILGTSVNFYIARIGGRPLMLRLMKREEMEKVDQFADKIGWKFIFFAWFVPGGTADIAGYAAGLTKMRYWKYFVPALLSAFLLALLTSAAGASFAVSPLLTALFTVGALLGIIFGAKIIILVALAKKAARVIRKKIWI